jgi:hypothetical protein
MVEQTGLFLVTVKPRASLMAEPCEHQMVPDSMRMETMMPVSQDLSSAAARWNVAKTN